MTWTQHAIRVACDVSGLRIRLASDSRAGSRRSRIRRQSAEADIATVKA